MTRGKDRVGRRFLVGHLDADVEEFFIYRQIPKCARFQSRPTQISHRSCFIRFRNRKLM